MSSTKEFNEGDEEQLLEEGFEYDQINESGYLFNSDDFTSTPFIKSENCTINEKIIQLQYPLLNTSELVKVITT